MANPLTIALGKLIQQAARLKGGSGSAFPGLVVERLSPDFAVGILKQLPRGVVVISGTNGKTTTTKIVTELLQSQGLRVFTNSTGSNFMRGVIASLLSQVSLGGRLNADIAVLELDEAHAVSFVQKIAPRYSLLLNVMRDQLDRFGEIDHTADLLAIIARHTTEATIINREDNRLARFAQRPETLDSPARLLWYGLAPALRPRFPQDDELYADESGKRRLNHSAPSSGQSAPAPSRQIPPLPQVGAASARTDPGQIDSESGTEAFIGASQGTWDPERMDGVLDRDAADVSGSDFVAGDVDDVRFASDAPHNLQISNQPHSPQMPDATVTLESLSDGLATYLLDGVSYQTPLALKGIYNAYNAAAALALVRVVLDDPASDGRLMERLATVRSAFGRGEAFVVDGRELELLLVKNPGGFRLALESFDARGFDTMIAINDEYADGRDMSWLYDVDFSVLEQGGVAMVSGTRAWDMALRLRYDEVGFVAVDTELERALDGFIGASRQSMRLYCTYTAMLRCRRHLGNYTSVSQVR